MLILLEIILNINENAEYLNQLIHEEKSYNIMQLKN